MIKEMTELLKQIDTEGLHFLKKQMAILIYNQEVERKNQKAAEKKKKAPRSSETKSKKKQRTPPPLEVFIEQLDDGRSFILQIRKSRLFMDVQEIKALYKIARAAGSAETGSQRLYNWLKKERKDVLIDGGINNSASPVLPLVYQELLDSFSAG